MAKTTTTIAVIGAGVVGLSSALAIQRSVPNVKVTVIADRFDESTTSWGAGGMFRLDLASFPEYGWNRLRRWSRDSWRQYSRLAHSEEAHASGMAFVAGTLAWPTELDRSYSLMSELSPDFHKLDESQVREMNLPPMYKGAYNFTSLLTHTGTYLKWLLKQFRDCGGAVECRTVSSLSELRERFDIVVNCTGLRAGELCEDKEVYPIMGHILKVKAPWFKQFFWCADLYIFPHDEYLVIGGIRRKGVSSLVAEPENRQKLLATAYRLFPKLKDAPIVGEWVGLRPARTFVRLELEHVKCGTQKPLPVVHNYGHGGHGVTLSWGCALHATQLIQELLSGTQAKL